MKKFFFVLLLLVIFSVSCGGGGGGGNGSPLLPPGGRDLSGLEGNWYAEGTYELSYTLDGETETESGIEVLDWYITKNAIKSYGTNDIWSYNGTTLYILVTDDSLIIEPHCGKIKISGPIIFTIPVTPGATSAEASGTGNYTVTSTNCGSGTGSDVCAGTLVKR